MAEISLKLQLDSIEQQLKVLKSKMLKQSAPKKMSALYGIFEGQMDFSKEELQQFKYPAYDKI